jgi:phosphatidylglycerophosphatase A
MKNIVTCNKWKFYLSKFISTFGFIGLIKYAPGTFGSIIALPLGLGLIYIAKYLSSFEFVSFISIIEAERDIILIFTVQLVTIIVLFILGTIASSYYSKSIETPDPKEVVIDEVVGQLLTTNLSCMGYFFISYSAIGIKLGEASTMWIFLVAIPFVLFRLFDIFKPWPINFLDKNIKGGFGIMIDDVAAAIFAAVSYYFIVFTLLDWFR